jgi:hypothetical protein
MKSYAYHDLPKDDYRSLSRLDDNEQADFLKSLVEIFRHSPYEVDVNPEVFYPALVNRYGRISPSQALCAIWMGVTGQLCRVYDKIRPHDILAKDGFIQEFFRFQMTRP